MGYVFMKVNQQTNDKPIIYVENKMLKKDKAKNDKITFSIASTISSLPIIGNLLVVIRRVFKSKKTK